MSAPTRTITVRHVQLLRALFAAAAALMITFSPDHSAAVGLSVFTGFAMATALALAIAAGLVVPRGSRWPLVLIAVVSILASTVGSVPAWRSTTLFFVIVITWALLTGLVELLGGLRARKAGDALARDAISVGVLTILLGLVLLVIPVNYAIDYTIEEAGTFTLTGIILGVGIFGGYAAIIAVYLAIAGFSPQRADSSDSDPAVPEHSDRDDAVEASGPRRRPNPEVPHER
ncbi:MAG: acyl-CoA synthetase [Actinomycetota bacterium]